MKSNENILQKWKLLVVALFLTGTASAHDPVFGVGPHVLYKDGIEIHAGVHQEKSDERTTESEIELKYGITADWAIGVGISYISSNSHDGTENGRGPSNLFTKYRFWRDDTFAAQESAAIFGKVIFDDGENNHHNVNREGNDYLLGLAYGYEGRKWYRWASVRHRINADAVTGIKRPDVWKFDLVGGIRFSPTEYHEPDWVWMLELNGEIFEHVSQPNKKLGGEQWFLSPGLMWTYRNFALKAGVQFSISNNLSSDQEGEDYRALIEFEWHL